MWKVLIADDEPKIRQGLKNTLEMFNLPITVCAEAKNGLEALDKAMEYHPDILLVDICMPRLGGIQFLEELKKLSMDSRIIIISGFNEFAYAKKAISLGVSHYLLKPISDEELKEALENVIMDLGKTHKSQKFLELMKQQFVQNKEQLREVFFNDWIEGKLSGEEWNEQKEVLEIDIPDSVMMILVSAQYVFSEKMIDGSVSEELYKMTLKKIVSDLLCERASSFVFTDRYQDIVALVGGYCENMETFYRNLSQKMDSMAEGKCCVQIRSCHRDEVPQVYKNLHSHARKVLACRPIVLEARKYIYAHYQLRDLDLTQVADAIGCNASYLSRIMKQELGISFKDFLTMLRISHAIFLMRNETLSLNQIAEQVGYNNQHYFLAAFKNYQGVSPSEFRKALNREEEA